MTDQKKIAIISSDANSLINFRGHLIQAFVKKGLRVYALAPDLNDEKLDKIRNLGAEPVPYRLSRSGMNPLRDFWDTMRLFFLLRYLKPNYSLGYFIKPVIYGTIAAWLAGVPGRFAMIAGLGFVFTDSHTDLSFKRKTLRFVVAKLYTFALSLSEKVFFFNPDDINEFVEKRIVSKGKAIRLRGTGVDLQEWPSVPAVTSPMTFLMVARLLKEKGVQDYAAAARIIKAAHPEVRFVLLGDIDSNLGALSIEQVKAWVQEGSIEWPGYAEVRPWLRQASVFVLPSYYREGVPRSTQEALAMGRPVITTDVPGCRETVISGHNGVMVPARDPYALAQAMQMFITNPDLVISMGENSRRLAEDRFDVHQINSHILSVMELS